MKRYELKLVDGGKGVFKVSVVKDPAIESTLVYFSKEKEEVTMFADEEKKVIYSVVMRPDLDIFRKNVDGEPANVYYTKETVEKAQINYFRQNGNSATNINHSDVADADGIFPFESWIVSDAKTDRALKFGLDVKDGDWVMGLKVDNDELWNEHIKTGKLDGFSVEATNINYELKEDTKMNTDKKENKVLAFLKEGFNKLVGDAENFEGQIAEVNKWWNTVMNDTFEIGETVLRKPYESKEKGAPKEEPKPVSAGEYELKDGSRILCDSEGVIRYKTAALTPAAPAPAPADPNAAPAAAAPAAPAAEAKMAVETTAAPAAPAAPAPAAPAAETKLTDEEIKALQAENAALKAELATLKAEKVKTETTLATMKTEKEAVDAKLLAMSKQTPAAQFVKDLPPAPEVKKYEDMTNAEKMRFNRENKKY